jgi:hypothetical protein
MYLERSGLRVFTEIFMNFRRMHLRIQLDGILRMQVRRGSGIVEGEIAKLDC